MDFDEIKQILAMVKEHELAEFELEHQDFKIRIRKDGGHPRRRHGPRGGRGRRAGGRRARAGRVRPALRGAGGRRGRGDRAGDREVADRRARSIARPSRAPGPFVEVGDVVKKGQVLCIIEAMKLMNEIDSEYDGEVVKVYVENGQAVQFGERLFAIRAK